MIPGLDRDHIHADRLDDTGALMPEHNRPVEREPPDTVDDMQIAVADAGGRRADQHLAPPRLVDLHCLDCQRLAHLAKDRSLDLHGYPPLKFLVSGGALRLPLIAPSRRIDRLGERSGSERGGFPLGGRIGVKRRALAWLAP